jgi:hypothetical protein
MLQELRNIDKFRKGFQGDAEVLVSGRGLAPLAGKPVGKVANVCECVGELGHLERGEVTYGGKSLLF